MTRFTLETITEFYNEASRTGAVIEGKGISDEWLESAYGPCIGSLEDNWRLKQERKPREYWLNIYQFDITMHTSELKAKWDRTPNAIETAVHMKEVFGE